MHGDSPTPDAAQRPDDSNWPPVAPVTFRTAFLFWLKLGFISFGGPAGQIAVMHQELVDRRRWISERRFLHALNYCMVLPGPEAQQLATYIGWLLHRTWGGIMAGALFVLPSLLILIGLSWLYVAFGHTSWMAGLFYGVKPAVVAIVLQAAHRIGSRTLKNPALWTIAAASFIGVFAFQWPFPAIVLAAGLAGLVGGRVAPRWFAAGGQGHAAAAADAARRPALIDDDTPPPAHARFVPSRLGWTLLAGGLLWAVPMGALTLALGWPHTLTQMAWFFSKAALLTFGGAYAVLPYVYQGAVSHYGWLSGAQMMDGLALGETTPGPLIMVVAFVAFVGACLDPQLQTSFGAEHAFLAGAAAATLVTWFTFLPSFVFILAGGPLVESTRGNIGLTAPLTAITAAVVGVIANLALFFAQHVLWPGGFDAPFDVAAAGIAALSAVALLRWQRPVMQVILAAAVLGLLLRWAKW